MTVNDVAMIFGSKGPRSSFRARKCLSTTFYLMCIVLYFPCCDVAMCLCYDSDNFEIVPSLVGI